MAAGTAQIGTWPYMAPELMRKNSTLKYGTEIDVYRLLPLVSDDRLRNHCFLTTNSLFFKFV